jgi:hypothetical protein
MPDPVSWPLDVDDRAPSRARELVTSHCCDRHPDVGPGDLHVALLLVTELVTNAVRHACGPVDLCVNDAPDRFRVDVSDGGSGLAEPARPLTPVDVYADQGRGLFLVDQLSSSWGVVPTPGHGTQVWFELPPLA